MLRVVLDTNVILSAILFGGKPRQILEAAFEGNIQIYISEPMLSELAGVLQRPKFGFKQRIIQSIIMEITSVAECIDPKQNLRIIKEDPSDNRIIECATEAKAQYIVTGDKHLLRLNESYGVRMVNPDKFIDILNTEKT